MIVIFVYRSQILPEKKEITPESKVTKDEKPDISKNPVDPNTSVGWKYRRETIFWLWGYNRGGANLSRAIPCYVIATRINNIVCLEFMKTTYFNVAAGSARLEALATIPEHYCPDNKVTCTLRAVSSGNEVTRVCTVDIDGTVVINDGQSNTGFWGNNCTYFGFQIVYSTK